MSPTQERVHSPVTADIPSSEKRRVPGCHVPTESMSEFGRESFSPGCGDGLGHRFVEKRTENGRGRSAAGNISDD